MRLHEIAKPPSLRPAIRHNGRVYVGIGTHMHALDAMPAEHRRSAMGDGDNRGYVTPTGRFLDRERAAHYARANNLWRADAPHWVVGARELASEYLNQYGHRPVTEAIREGVADEAKTLFGITRNPRECGYILADGTMLDLSGRHQVESDYRRAPDGSNALRKPGTRDWMADQRSTDHREVNGLYSIGNGTEAMRRFMAEAPALRFQPGNGFEANAVPTSRQLATAMAAHFSITGEPAYIDVSDARNGDTLDSQSFTARQVRQAAKFIEQALARKLNEQSGRQSLAGWPIKKLSKVYHVGTLDLQDKAGDSYEGSGISVSLDPFAWVKIARIGGSPLWVAEKKGGAFLDSAKLSEAQRQAMFEWASSQGLVQSKPEAGGFTLADAMRQRMIVPKATDDGYLKGLVAVAFAEDVLQLDGVWWHIRTQGLHAPRGVIVPSKAKSWAWSKRYEEYP